jgi:3-hydroxybutyryl-CoA dehydrogenase
MHIPFEDIKTFLVLGCGTLGLRVGLQAAISGYHVVQYDIAESSFAYAQKTQGKILDKLVKTGKLTQSEASTIKDRIRWTTNPETAATQADFVNESVTEDVAIKKAVWKQFGALCPRHAVLTTNTSYLLPSLFANETGSPERFCAFHFHDVFQARVVDIMPHQGTDPSVCALLMKMGVKLEQIPVFVKQETPGYIFNAMLMSLIGAAGHLLTAGKAGIEDIDRSWIGNFHMHAGPFGILDEIGLDTAYHVTKNMKDEKSQRFAALLKEYVDLGKLGVKTGEGFYQYPNPAYRQPDFLWKNAL